MTSPKVSTSSALGGGVAAALLLGLSSPQAYAEGCQAVKQPTGPIDSGTAISRQELTSTNYLYPSDLVKNPSPTQTANYAWRLFIASMQQTSSTLTSGSGRGVPDGKHNFIDTGVSTVNESPLVFESLYHRTEAFPYYAKSSGSDPRANQPDCPIGNAPTYHTYYKEGETVPVTLPNDTYKQPSYVYLDETNQISQNLLYYTLSKDADFPVLFMAKVNQLETEYAFNQTSSPSPSKSWDFPDTVLEVKTAWRRARDLRNSSVDKYHQATANYWEADANGTPSLVTDTFVLIAIHIIQKTANYPEFIFTTFEHVDAVTRDVNGQIIDPAYKTEYNQLAYETYASAPSQRTHMATPLGAYNVNAVGQPPRTNKLTTYTLPKAGPISQDYTTVVQPNTITSEVNNVNNQVNQLVASLDSGNVWANYRLKGVQATPSSDQNSNDYFLANIVVESSQPGIQLFNGILLNAGVPKESNGRQYLVNCRDNPGSTSCVYPPATTGGPSTYNNVSLGVTAGNPVPAPYYNMGGCQGCHGAAQQKGRDFSFLANGVLGNGKELDSVPATHLTAAQKKAHNTTMSESSNAY